MFLSFLNLHAGVQYVLKLSFVVIPLFNSETCLKDVAGPELLEEHNFTLSSSIAPTLSATDTITLLV